MGLRYNVLNYCYTADETTMTSEFKYSPMLFSVCTVCIYDKAK